MKVTKILTDLLKKVEKGDLSRAFYGVDKEYTFYSPDGYRGFKIPSKRFLVDLEKALPNKAPIMDFKKFLKDDESRPAYKTNEIRKIKRTEYSKKEINVVKIVNENTYAWIQESYLKEFEVDCTFKISSPKSPVFIYEEDELVGLILPVFVREV